MSDDLARHNSDDEDSFYANNNAQNDDGSEEQVITKSNIHTNKKKPIAKRKEKGVKGAKRPHSNKEKEKQIKMYQFAEKKAESLLEEMEKCFDKDIDLYKKKQLACKKLTFLDSLSKELKNIYISEKFLELNGLGTFQKWLSKINIGDGGEGVEPSISLRKGIFQILLFLNVRSDHIVRAQQLQRIIQKNKRSQTKQLRDLSEQIIIKWSQMMYDDGQ